MNICTDLSLLALVEHCNFICTTCRTTSVLQIELDHFKFTYVTLSELTIAVCRQDPKNITIRAPSASNLEVRLVITPYPGLFMGPDFGPPAALSFGQGGSLTARRKSIPSLVSFFLGGVRTMTTLCHTFLIWGAIAP